MTLSPVFRRGLLIAALVIVLDQASKWWILERIMLPPRVIEVTPFFNLVLTWNRGVSFGLFNTDSPLNAWLLPLVALVILAMLLVWLARADRGILAHGLGLIIGGAIGNLIDRVRFGAVADFLDVHVWGYHWPAFNVADSAITIGVVVLIFDSLFGTEKERSAGDQGRRAKLGRETGE
jgi:signal peptidase II